MANNVRSSSAGSSDGILFGTDELVIDGSTVHVPYNKIVVGALDSTGYFVSTDAGFPVQIMGSTTISVSGSTVSVSGSTVSVSGSSISLSGVSTNTGLPVFILGSTTLSVSGSTVSVSGSTISVSGSSVTLNGVSSDAGLPVRIMGSTTLSVSGSTISVSGSSITLNGVSSDAGLPVRIMSSTTILVSGSTISVSGSTVSVSGSTVSVSGSTVSVSGSTVNVINGSTFLVQPQAYTAGGVDPYSALNTTSVVSAQVKGSSGQVYSFDITNTSTTPVYARLYNQTGAPASTDDANIKFRIAVPADASAMGAGFCKVWPMGVQFATGIGIRVTGGVNDTDTTGLPAAGTIMVNVGYK